MRFILVLCAAILAHAQTPAPASLSGRAADPSGAIMPGVTVRLADSLTGRSVTAVTNYRGVYTFTSLRAGTYRLQATAAGFQPWRRDDVTLATGESARVDIDLSIQGASSRVTVTAKAPPGESALETRTRNFEEVLEIREVRESAAKDVGEALSRVDGIWKIRKAGIANDLILRGFQQDNINVLIDGVRIYGACPNNMDPPSFHVDFAEIQQVDVLKGPFDIRNEGSLGGAVRLVSKNPAQGFTVTPTLSAGSFSYYNPSVTVSQAGERLFGLAGYSLRRSEPYLDGSGKRVTSYANFKPDTQNLNAFDVNTGWLKFGGSPAANQRFNVAFTRQDGNLVLYPYLQMDALYDNADRLSASYSVDGAGPFHQVRADGYFTRVKHWMTDEYRLSSVGAARPYGMGSFAATKALGGRIEGDLGGLTAGFEGFRRNWNTVNTLRLAGAYQDQHAIPDVYTSNAGLYAMYRGALGDRLQASAGARLDAARSSVHSANPYTDLYWAYKGTREVAHTDVSPSANLWLAYAAGGGFELFAGGGYTFRLPDPQERYFSLRRMGSDWVGNPGLKPTRNTEVDLGLNYRGGRFSLRPTLFYSRLADFIAVHNQALLHMVPKVMNTAARSYANVDARQYGGELGYSVGVTRDLLLAGGLSWVRGIKDSAPAIGIRSRDMAEMPPLRSHTRLRYGTKLLFLEAEGILASAQKRADFDLKEQRTAGYGVANLKAGVHTSKLNFAAGVDNLFDRYYYEHTSFQRDPFRLANKVPEPGRSLYLTASYAF